MTFFMKIYQNVIELMQERGASGPIKLEGLALFKS